MRCARDISLLLCLLFALCGAAAAQPSAPPERRPTQPDSDEQRITDLVEKDVIELDRDSVPIDPQAPRTNGERFIHGEIYRIRPDVQAIVHSHSPAVIPFSISPDRPLRPVLHMAGFLPAQVSVFDHRDVSKDDPSLRGKLMVNNAKLGAALAKTLANDSVVLIRGHGNAVVGASLPWAVLRAVYTQLNARIQMEAAMLGQNVIYLNEDELKMHPVEVFDVERPWQNLKSRLPKSP